MLPQYYKAFRENGFDTMDMLKMIDSQQDLVDIGVELPGHRKLLMSEINKLKGNICSTQQPQQIILTTAPESQPIKEKETIKSFNFDIIKFLHFLWCFKPMILLYYSLFSDFDHLITQWA
eukprot:145673_1